MKTATVRDLRNKLARDNARVDDGESVVKVDFEKQVRQTWGTRVLDARQVAAMREAELEGEDG